MSAETTLITGGAGFVGTNLADRLLRDGGEVVVLDDLSRAGVHANLEWLERTHGSALRTVVADIADPGARDVLRGAVAEAGRVVHLAAQVAVTTSVEDPMRDFAVNAAGTVALLDELRRLPSPPPLLFTSTNKVYGAMADVSIVRRGSRYEPEDPALVARGVGEDRPLSFCSPYGCSKGAADQYVLDHATTYGVPSVVFRMSCIYGPHQCGNEDQGWVAHFLRESMAGRPLTIYGDGRQVRDVLYVDDLVEAVLLALDRAEDLSGQAFNIGGGPTSTVSLRELLQVIEDLDGRAPEVTMAPWRVGDQRWYVSDTARFAAATGWAPSVAPADGVASLHRWLQSDQDLAPVAGS